ncbi:MAG: DUF4159 domain-containing protein [Candidatus Latescibacterota bacterium]|nr:DUF4159 domain-containing protein [Candidatus Latescibacterota bacterium]
MHPPPRFASATAGLDLDALLGPLRRLFWLSLGLAVLLHLTLVIFNPFQQQAQKVPRPLTTKFVKRQPRLTKALELRKIPKFKRQMIRREVRVAKARMDQVQATAAFSTRTIIARATSLAQMQFVRQMHPPTHHVVLEPQMGLEMDLGISRTPENKIDMGLEMLDVDAMDTGRYRAVVVQDPNDKQALKGFIKLARVVSASYVAETQTNVVDGGLNNQEIDILRDMLNEWTGLQADFAGSLTFDDDRLLEVPIIIPQGAPNEGEMENLARYLLAGGFVMAEEFDFDGIWTEALEKYGGLVKGRDFYTERLPEDHPVFSAYFDLRAGVAQGATRFDDPYYWNVVKGLYVKGRLVAIPRANSGIGGYLGFASDRDSTRILQFAVNTVVYALTQEGSMTQRLMQIVH